MPMKVPERHRVTEGPLGSDRFYGNNGAFQLPEGLVNIDRTLAHHSRIRGELRCLTSSSRACPVLSPPGPSSGSLGTERTAMVYY